MKFLEALHDTARTVEAAVMSSMVSPKTKPYRLAKRLASRVVRLSPLRWGQAVLSGVSTQGVAPVRLHLRSDLHLARKLWHMVMGCFIGFVYMSGMDRTHGVVLLGLVFVMDLSLEAFRLRSPSFNEKVVKLWGPLMRSCELHRLSGVPYYLAASIMTIGVLPKPIAILSILYLACGDPIASLFGVLYGDRGPRFVNGKSWIGTGAGIMTCVFVSWLFVTGSSLLPDLSWTQAVILSLVGGIAGGTAELLPLEIDDNFSIPIVSGFALWISFIVMGI